VFELAAKRNVPSLFKASPLVNAPPDPKGEPLTAASVVSIIGV
jgi:hypothetical protein